MKLLKTACFFLFTVTNLLFSQTTYIWNGSVNSNFSTAGNWTPLRQIGLVTDILVFETGSNLNVINVNQVTIGQLIVRNNTNLTLSPSTGNAKCVTIRGTAGTDLKIEQGSGLRILGSDPMLNFYLDVNATGEIFGTLTFEGNISHNINSAAPGAIHFKNGSIFTQLSPGCIFNNTGAANCVVFEAGSKFRMNHPGALSPFGLVTPNTKVIFEESSILDIYSMNSLQLNGRNFADIVIEPGFALNISENFTSNTVIGSIEVKNSAAFRITNTNPSYIPVISINGSINTAGIFQVNAAAENTCRIAFDGTDVQVISGTGEMTFSEHISSMLVYNNIKLNRDLTIDCRVISNGGVFDLNGHVLNLNPVFPSPYNYNRDPITGQDITSTGSSTDNKLQGSNSVPSEYRLSQNYPNPFNPATKINFELPRTSAVTLKVYDITGRLAVTLVNGTLEAGYHTAELNASNLTSGVYFYTITAGDYTKTLKMILAK